MLCAVSACAGLTLETEHNVRTHFPFRVAFRNSDLHHARRSRFVNSIEYVKKFLLSASNCSYFELVHLANREYLGNIGMKSLIGHGDYGHNNTATSILYEKEILNFTLCYDFHRPMTRCVLTIDSRFFKTLESRVPSTCKAEPKMGVHHVSGS